MSHYWAANEDPRLRAALAEDWLGDLREFGPDIVGEACEHWRRGQSKRPTIADIRGICFALRQERQPVPALPPPTAEERREAARAAAKTETRYAEGFAWRQQFAEEHGLPDFTAVIAIGIRNVANRQPRGAARKPAPEIEKASVSPDELAALLALMDKRQ